MGKRLLFFIVLVIVIIILPGCGQPEEQCTTIICYNGLYRTYLSSQSNAEYNEYLRFYADGTVLSVTSTGEPWQVISWLEKDAQHVSMGQYQLNGSALVFTVNGENGEVDFTGTINGRELTLHTYSHINGNKDTKVYRFVENPSRWSALDRTICWGIFIFCIILGFINLMIEIIKRKRKKEKPVDDPVEAAIAARRAAVAMNISPVKAAPEPGREAATAGQVLDAKSTVAGFCPHCGTPLLSSDKFCTKCGIPRRVGIAEQASLVGIPSASSVPASPAQPGEKDGLAEKYFAQAYDFNQNSEYKMALEVCDKVVALAPDWSDGHNLRGVILENMGCLDDAIYEYRTAIRLEPADEDARENLALVLKESSKGRKRVGKGNQRERFKTVKNTQAKKNLWISFLTIMVIFLVLCALIAPHFLKDMGILAKLAGPGMLIAWDDICDYTETKTVVAIDGYFPVFTLSVLSIGGQEYKIPFYKSPDELDQPGVLDMLNVRIEISKGDFRGGTMSPNKIAEIPDGYTSYDFLVMADDGTNLHVGDKARLSGKVIGDVECVLMVSFIEAK